MMPYKRPAADKSGMPVYQPSATTYQQLMQLQQQPFVPVSCEYTSPPPIPTTQTSQQTQQTQVALNSSVSCASPAAAATAPTAVSVAAVASTQSTDQQTKTQNHGPDLSVVTVTQVQEPEPVVSAAPIQPPPLPPNALDPATIAKEVAQQNYAKAVKLAAVSQSYGLNSALTALNYTGVALNKQPVTIPAPAMPRYPTLPFAFTGTAAPTHAGLGLTSLTPNPFSAQAAAVAAQAAQPNILAFTRPPPTVINPYSLLRPYPGTPTATAAPTLLQAQNPLLAAQYPQFAPQVAIPQTSVSVALPTQTNNNNCVLQPYKKMKTT